MVLYFTMSRPPGLSNLCSNFAEITFRVFRLSRLILWAYLFTPASGPVVPMPKFSTRSVGLEFLPPLNLSRPPGLSDLWSNLVGDLGNSGYVLSVCMH